MIAASLSFNAERSKVIDYVYPFSEDTTVALLAVRSQNNLYFLLPLSQQVWLGCVGTVFLFGILLWIVHEMLYPSGYKYLMDTKGTTRFDHLCHWLWIFYGAVFTQSEYIIMIHSPTSRLSWTLSLTPTPVFVGHFVNL